MNVSNIGLHTSFLPPFFLLQAVTHGGFFLAGDDPTNSTAVGLMNMYVAVLILLLNTY